MKYLITPFSFPKHLIYLIFFLFCFFFIGSVSSNASVNMKTSISNSTGSRGGLFFVTKVHKTAGHNVIAQGDILRSAVIYSPENHNVEVIKTKKKETKILGPSFSEIAKQFH